MPRATATLLITCPDRPGIVAGVAGFLLEEGANIVHADQHVDREEDLFLQRVEFDLEGIDLDGLTGRFAKVAGHFDMRWSLRTSIEPTRVAVLVSRQPHCLTDLLARWEMGELPGKPVTVVSNHPDHADLVGHFGVPYHHLPVEKDKKAEQEARLLEVLDDAGADLVVLARYMQILSPEVVDAYPRRIINIHHSFLPAFAGGRPYHQAHERGVKVIGATAHYVTAELDEGPIIEQDVARVSHRDEVLDLVQKGRDLEKVVLARAVRAHLEHRVLVYRNRTAVFA
jgi:formyltetrahydrofolate deformylase